LAVASALLFAAATRLPDLTATLLVAYLAFVANIGLVTLALSPLREVTRAGLTVAEVVLFAGAFAGWWYRGRPGLPLAAARRAVLEVAADPVTALFMLVVALLLGYELLVGLTMHPNNSDSLAYHMAKAAAWAQHGGIYWIPDAPTIRLNAFQPLAEQELLFLFVATGSGVLFAIPQFLAELAILLAVYGSARRLGFEVRPAACSAFLFATFSLVALEATTGQNDLVAASMPAVAMCLLLGRRGLLEPALAGVAAGLGLGVKLTTALVLPILALLAVVRGRKPLVVALAGGVFGLVSIGMWGYVLNEIHTGELLGAGTGPIQYRAPPSYPGSVANAFYLLYGMMDLSVLSNRMIYTLALTGVVIGLGAAAWATLRGVNRRRTLGEAAGVATPFLSPLLVLGGAAAVAFVAGVWSFPIRGPEGILEPLNEVLQLEYTRFAHENYSAFGPHGIVALLGATALTIWASVAHRVEPRHLLLASALPVFLILVSLQVRWHPFLLRFFLIPAVFAAPLLAYLFRSRSAIAAYLVVAALTAGLTITRAVTKPLQSPLGAPWHVTQVEALNLNSRHELDQALPAFEALVPDDACIGAILGDSEPSFLLFGPQLQRRVVYLPVGAGAVQPANKRGLLRVLVSTAPQGEAEAVGAFQNAGWRAEALGGPWYLVSHVDAEGAACSA
jgi:Glycosyltransferase family 87